MRATYWTTLALALTGGATTPLSAATLSFTDFEGLALTPYVSPTETGKGDGTDWTSTLPAGWTMTFTGPLGDPLEFQGWRVMDVDSWVATEGNQDRGLWTRGGVGAHGSVLVADGDAYDDGTNIDTGLMNTFARTPAVDLSGLAPGSVTISFDSFWRNEETQKGSLGVSYDGGATFEILKAYDSAALADGLVIDEHLDIAVNNPGSGSMVFEFAYTDASNDWWWAIDNVNITALAVPEPSVLSLGLLGVAALALRRRR
jgi:MYXO-CTERM domain-containing protein